MLYNDNKFIKDLKTPIDRVPLNYAKFEVMIMHIENSLILIERLLQCTDSINYKYINNT